MLRNYMDSGDKVIRRMVEGELWSERLDKLFEIYNSLPDYDCERCGECCLAVSISRTEFLAIMDYVRRTFGRREKELLVSYRLGQLKPSGQGMCAFWNDMGLCEVYPARPLICRAYGAVEGIDALTCPKAEGSVLSERVFRKFEDKVSRKLNQKMTIPGGPEVGVAPFIFWFAELFGDDRSVRALYHKAAFQAV